MKFKTLWTNYKIYGIIVGIVLGTVVYNMISIDFSFSYIDSIRNIDFLDTYMYQFIRFLRFYIFILVVSFFNMKEKVYTVFLGLEAFKFSGNIVVMVRLHNMLCFGTVIEELLKIIILYLFMKEERPVLNRIVAFIMLLLGVLAETFFINFL